MSQPEGVHNTTPQTAAVAAPSPTRPSGTVQHPQHQQQPHYTHQTEPMNQTTYSTSGFAPTEAAAPPPPPSSTSSTPAPRTRTHSSVCDRVQALALHAAGWKTSKIEEITEIKQESLKSLLRKAKKRGYVVGGRIREEHVRDAPRSGRPKTGFLVTKDMSFSPAPSAPSAPSTPSRARAGGGKSGTKTKGDAGVKKRVSAASTSNGRRRMPMGNAPPLAVVMEGAGGGDGGHVLGGSVPPPGYPGSESTPGFGTPDVEGAVATEVARAVAMDGQDSEMNGGHETLVVDDDSEGEEDENEPGVV